MVYNSCVAEWGFDPRTSDFRPFLNRDSNSFLTTLQITSCPVKPNRHPSTNLGLKAKSQTLNAFSPSPSSSVNDDT